MLFIAHRGFGNNIYNDNYADFKLTAEEIEGVNALNKGIRLCHYTVKGKKCFFN